MVPKEIASL